ncbi:trans-sialidase [Trypanosoma cruzi]|nr:trans-sialidase [Trypanosoma cruzi]
MGAGLLSALGGSGCCAPCPNCECGMPPATTRCEAQCYSVGAERSEGLRRGLGCAPSPSLRPCACVCVLWMPKLICPANAATEGCGCVEAPMPLESNRACGTHANRREKGRNYLPGLLAGSPNFRRK